MLGHGPGTLRAMVPSHISQREVGIADLARSDAEVFIDLLKEAWNLHGELRVNGLTRWQTSRMTVVLRRNFYWRFDIGAGVEPTQKRQCNDIKSNRERI